MHRFDLRDTIVPFTLLKISNTFKEMRDDAIMEVLWRDAETRAALFKILPESSYDIICDEKIEGSNEGFRIQLKKKNSRRQRKRSGDCDETIQKRYEPTHQDDSRSNSNHKP